MTTMNFEGVRELSATGTVRDVGRNYARNALPWCGLAVAISVLGTLVPLLMVISNVLSEGPAGPRAHVTIPLMAGALFAVVLIVGCLHKVTAYALLSASGSAFERRVSGLETKQTSRFFAEAFICATVVVLAAFATL